MTIMMLLDVSVCVTKIKIYTEHDTTAACQQGKVEQMHVWTMYFAELIVFWTFSKKEYGCK